MPNSIHSWHSNQTSQTLHLKNISFLLSVLLIYPMPLLRTTRLVQLLLHMDTSWSLSPILHCSAHYSTLPTLYTPHSFCVPQPFHILHQLPLATPCRYFIIIIIIIKKDWQYKAWRGRLTPYQSEDPSSTLPTYRGKEEKGKLVEDKKGDSN